MRRSSSSSASGLESICMRKPRRRLVDEVDRLVGQEAVGDVAVGEHGGGDERRIGDAHAVMQLVFLLQPAQDRDGVLDRRLGDEDRLEAPGERRVLLDVLAIFVERGGADAMELAAGERRLQQVRGVHGAVGLAGADQGVHLVDEQDDLAVARPGSRRARPSAAPRTRRDIWRRRSARRGRATAPSCPSGSPARRH